MLCVLLSFVYIGLTSGIVGFGVLSFLTDRRIFFACLKEHRSGICRETIREEQYRIRHRLSYLLAGIVCIGVYAEIFSLFAPVGAAANLILLLCCAGILFLYRGRIREMFLVRTGAAGYASTRKKLPDGYLFPGSVWLLYVLLTLLIAYGTSHGIPHYDTGLYHAQSIRAIEEYGTIRGLANVHSRFGYNSASFALSALYGFSFSGTRPLHTAAGFFALLLAFACLNLTHIARRGRPVLTDLVRIAGLYYLFNIFKEMNSPAPDYFLNCLLFCILILWTDLDVRHERHFLPYGLLCAGVCYAVTVKLSAAGLLLLCIKPLLLIPVSARRSAGNESYRRQFRGVRNGRSAAGLSLRMTAAFAGIFLLIVLPYVARNLLISGWALYPSTFPDIFSFAWQIPHDLAEGDAAGIRAYAKGVSPVSPAPPGASLAEWAVPWFGAQTVTSKVLILADLCSFAGFILYLAAFVLSVGARYLGKKARGKKRSGSTLTPVFRISRYYLLRNSDFIFLEGVLLAAFLFWFLEAPLLRYGFFFVWTPALLLTGRLLLLLLESVTEQSARRFTFCFSLFLWALILYKGTRLILTDRALMRPEYLVRQQDYERFPVEPYEVDGVTFYYPQTGDQTGYYGFPGGDHRAMIRLLGDSLADGIAADR